MPFMHSSGARARERRDVILSIHDVKREGSIARVSISAGLLTRLGWSRGDMLSLGIGFGADACWAELRRGDGTRLRSPARGSRLFWQMVAPLGWPLRLKACAPTVQVGDGAVRILLPWMVQARETALPQHAGGPR